MCHPSQLEGSRYVVPRALTASTRRLQRAPQAAVYPRTHTHRVATHRVRRRAPLLIWTPDPGPGPGIVPGLAIGALDLGRLILNRGVLARYPSRLGCSISYLMPSWPVRIQVSGGYMSFSSFAAYGNAGLPQVKGQKAPREPEETRNI